MVMGAERGDKIKAVLVSSVSINTANVWSLIISQKLGLHPLLVPNLFFSS